MVGQAGSTKGTAHADTMYDLEPIQGQGQSHRASKVAKIALFQVYLLCRFDVELRTDGCQ